MKRIYTICFLCLLTAITAMAQQIPFQSKWEGKEHVTLDFDIVVPDSLHHSNFAVWVMPFIHNGQGDSLTLSPVVFRGKKNQKYVDRARYFGDAPDANYDELALDDTKHYQVVLPTAATPWITEGRIEVEAKMEKEGCCEVFCLPQKHYGHFAYVPDFVPKYEPVKINTGTAGRLEVDNPVLAHISQYRPYDSTRILRKEKGLLYVNFPLDKIDLHYNFRNNSATLDKIVHLTREIMADTTSSVRLIQIIGMASIEGSIAHNHWLAQGRAVALKNYIQNNVSVPDSLFELCNGGEGWSEMRDQINDIAFDGQQEFLYIIDTTEDPNLRERKMKQLRGGVPYRFLKENLLQDQRNSGYMRIYFDYVPDTNAETINRASDLISQQRYLQALELLRPVSGDNRSWNALGVALYMTGEQEEGIVYLRKAAALGNADAQRNVRQYDAVLRGRKAAQ